jgi:RIO-like serine/threonine protein kinase
MPTLSREEIARARTEMLHKGPAYKADIYTVEVGDEIVVVKDYAGKVWWARIIGRIEMNHECNAYQWLGPMPGVPKFYGRIDAHAIAIEMIEGTQLVTARNRFESCQAHLKSIREIAGRFLASGFFHLDLRSRRNVMIRSDGQAMVFDLAGSFWVRPGTWRYRLLRPCLARYYWIVLLKWKKLLTLGRSDRDEKTRLEKLISFLRKPHRWITGGSGRHDDA